MRTVVIKTGTKSCPVYTVSLETMRGDLLPLADVEKGQWVLPRGVRWEIRWRNMKLAAAAGAEGDEGRAVTYCDTFAEAKEEISDAIHDLLVKP